LNISPGKSVSLGEPYKDVRKSWRCLLCGFDEKCVKSPGGEGKKGARASNSKRKRLIEENVRELASWGGGTNE